MSPIEFQRKLEAKIADLNTAKLIFPIAQEAQRRMIKRLFDEGEGAQGKLGKYSTDEGYFTKKQFKNKGAFRAKGKIDAGTKGVTRTKKTYETFSDESSGEEVIGRRVINTKFVSATKNLSGRFKNGNPRKSMFLEEGYKELKQIQGYESSFVNLTYSSDLRNDFSTGMMIKGDKVIAVVKRGINADKTKWLSDKYGEKTFKHTEEEKDFFRNEVSKELINYWTN